MKNRAAAGEKNLGFAFVTFTDDKGVRKGLNLNGHKVMNRPLVISIARDQPDDDDQT